MINGYEAGFPEDKHEHGKDSNLRASDAGTEIKMVVDSDVKDDVIVSETFICTRFEAFSYLLHGDGAVFFLASIEGADYNSALTHCAGDEEFLAEIVSDIASEGIARIERMKAALAADVLVSYERESHSIKSSMATIGLKALSNRARKHEFAVKESNSAFISEDSQSFMEEYERTCKILAGE